ncbi:MAG: hypothetical protein KA885_13470 [Spirochaetes bacterium]|nr:hypothetical protein [Spirochaetota bacterium]
MKKSFLSILSIIVLTIGLIGCQQVPTSDASASLQTIGVQLTAPTNLKAKFYADYDMIRLSWDHVLLAKGYVIFRTQKDATEDAAATNPWKQVGYVAENANVAVLTDCFFDDYDLESSSAYYYKILAISYNYNQADLTQIRDEINNDYLDYKVLNSSRIIESPYSVVANATAGVIKSLDQFTAPQNVRVIKTSEGGLFVKWDFDYYANTKMATKYTVRIEDVTTDGVNGTITLDGINVFEFSTADTVNATDNYLNIATIPVGKFRVGVYAKGKDSVAASQISYYANTITQYDNFATAPAATAVDGLFANNVMISWPIVSGANMYYLYRLNNATGLWDFLKSVSSASYNEAYNVVYTTDDTVSDNTKYNYKVYAANTVYGRVSQFGTATGLVGKSITDNSAFGLARINIGVGGNRTVTMSFSKITDAATYSIYRTYDAVNNKIFKEATNAVLTPPTGTSLLYTFTDVIAPTDYPTALNTSNDPENHLFAYRIVAKDANGNAIAVTAASVTAYTDLSKGTVNVDIVTVPGTCTINWTGIGPVGVGSPLVGGFRIKRFTNTEYGTASLDWNANFDAMGTLVTNASDQATNWNDPDWSGLPLAAGDYYYVVKGYNGSSVSYTVSAVKTHP